MNIVYSSSDSYAPIAGVSLYSLLKNNKQCKELSVFIIDNNISEKNKEKFTTLCAEFNRPLYFVPIADIEKLTGTSIDIGRWNISTFGRLFEASLLPEWVEKVIHVDCDTMIMSSLEPLWNTDMTGKTVAGALECIGDNYKTEIGLKPEDTYINAGNIMLNLKKSERTAQKKNLRNTFPHILNFLLLTRQCSTLAFRAVKNSLYPLNTTHIQWFIMLNTKP